MKRMSVLKFSPIKYLIYLEILLGRTRQKPRSFSLISQNLEVLMEIGKKAINRDST